MSVPPAGVAAPTSGNPPTRPTWRLDSSSSSKGQLGRTNVDNSRQGQLQVVLSFVFICGSFVTYSLLQERLLTVPFGPQQELFRASVFIILFNRLVTCCAALGALRWQRLPVRPAAPLLLFTIPSLANLLSSTAQYESLKFVSMPLQALAKACKMLPVMLWSICLRGRRQSGSDYACALAVTVGCVLFVTKGDIAAPQVASARAAGGAASPWLAAGLALLAAFLLFDGLASTSQDKLFHQFEMHSCNQLLWVSAWSALFSAAYLVATGQLAPAVSFVLRHPSCLSLIGLLSLVSTAVQLFIFFTIQQFGALSFAMLMTLRQFFSLVMSCLIFHHHPTALQWLGALLVVTALVLRTSYRARTGHLGPNAHGKGKKGASPPLIPVIAASNKGEAANSR